MATENDPPSGTPVGGAVPSAPNAPVSPAPLPPATPSAAAAAPQASQATAPIPPPSDIASAPAEAAPPPRPIAEINLVDSPELDRPDAFGNTVKRGKDEAEVGGGGAIAEKPYEAFEERIYNPDHSRDLTRQTITLWLIGLLCAMVGLTFVALFARGASTGFTDKDFFHELKQVLDVLVGPVITLLASAIGFYFGYKQGELGEQARNNKAPST